MDTLRKLLGLVDKVVPLAVGNRTKVCAAAVLVSKAVALFVPEAKPVADMIEQVCGPAAGVFALAGLARK